MALEPYQDEEKEKDAVEQQSEQQATAQAEQQKEAVKQLQPTVAPTPAPQPQARPAATTTPTPQVQQFGPSAQQLQQPTTTSKRTPTPISQYQRLQEYLRTNQPQAQGLGGQLQQSVRSSAAAGSQALGQAAQSFSQKVEEAGLTRNADRTSQLISKAANLKSGEALTDEELAELQNIASKQQGFEGLAPADLTAIAEYATAQQKLGEATQKASLTGTEAGREALLADIYGKKSPYVSGQALLDQLLTGSSKVPSEQLATLREKVVGGDVYGQKLSAAEKAAVARRLAEQQEVEKAAEDVQTGLGGAAGEGLLGGLEQQILDRVTAENKRAADTNALIDQVVSEGKIEAFGDTMAQKQLIQELGLTPEQVADIKATGGEDKDLIFNKLKDVSEQTATSPDEYARLNALYNIADMFGRQAQKLAVQEGEDLGSLIGQKASLDVEKIRAAKQHNEDLMKADLLTRGSNLSGKKPEGYRFGPQLDVVQAATDIMNRMTDKKFVASDNQEADKVLKVYQDELADYNNKRQAKGLSPVPAYAPSDADVLRNLKFVFENSFFYNNPAFGGGMRTIQDLQRGNPAVYNEMKEQAKRVGALEYYGNLFKVPVPQWHK